MAATKKSTTKKKTATKKSALSIDDKNRIWALLTIIVALLTLVGFWYLR